VVAGLEAVPAVAQHEAVRQVPRLVEHRRIWRLVSMQMQ
jgi:hypothetical protein